MTRHVPRACRAALALALVAALAGPPAARAHPPAQYGPAWWAPASPFNYAWSDRPRSVPITRIVIHVTNLTYAQTLARFRNPRAHVSAHYLVGSVDGRVTQMVPERAIAWHAGNRLYNATSIGIEHEGRVIDCNWFTDAMYRSSARLVAYLSRKYRIPLDRAHVIGHDRVPDPLHPGRYGGAGHHTDPGLCWDWTYYLGLARSYARGMTPPPLHAAAGAAGAAGSA